jgi:hypothetical protein
MDSYQAARLKSVIGMSLLDVNSEEDAPSRSRLYFANSAGALRPRIPSGAVVFATRLLCHIRASGGD